LKREELRLGVQWLTSLPPQTLPRTAHKYIPVAAATTAIHGGSTLLERVSGGKLWIGCRETREVCFRPEADIN
jgi:hypothetical protein